MKARMTMSSYSYSLLYMGSAEEAAAAPYEDYIEFDRADDYYVFTIPVRALNEPISCAAYRKRKQKWYSRTLLLGASTLPEEALNGLVLPDYELIDKAVEAYSGEEGIPAGSVVALGGNMDADNPTYGEAMEINLPDGRYSINVDIAGGSGRATVSTPTLLLVQDGKAYARLLWSSVYYDWMQVGGVTYPNETTDGGNSTFTIPVCSLDSLIPVVADTTAMGDPVAIQYTLTFYRESIGDEGLIPQEAAKKVVIVAVIIIVAGFVLNLLLKKRRRKK
ncbi:MAG: hypothetical protein MJ075_07465 [Oscillospiraceae bacterium]|nr:hypothetical protein [Oscillospiraceae bacterium]